MKATLRRRTRKRKVEPRRHSSGVIRNDHPQALGVIEGEFDNNPFNNLNAAILIKILYIALIFNNKPVYIISHLDLFYKPSEVPKNYRGHVSLLY
jgi:hypothetical protein